MADFDDDHDEVMVFYPADDPVIADAIALVTGIGAFEALANLTRIVSCKNTLIQIAHDAALYSRVELRQ